MQLQLFIKKSDIFIVFVCFFDSPNNDKKYDVYLFYKTLIVLLVANKASASIFIKYIDFTNIFISKLTFKIFKYIKINNYITKLIN